MNTIRTQNVVIPQLGFGTFRMPGGGCQPVVESALALGYRHLDTAAMYAAEDSGIVVTGMPLTAEEADTIMKLGERK